MKSYVTSYHGLFNRQVGDAPAVQRIEIPIIQRDYAQGRDSGSVARIRANFLDALHDALTTTTPISLDFVYGDVVDGTLRPLDGQQRLTTLFLLHWYLAWRAGSLEQESGWKRFEYATRPSARRFCECLVNSRPPTHAKLRTWFEDQPWFLHTWQHDPTIQSMLVMLEAIDVRFGNVDPVAAWAQLVDADAPGISFHLLPIEQIGLNEDLYIKMNSRGKPLTAFENFKAKFERVLEQSSPDRVEEFAWKVDGAWSDLLWSLRGGDGSVDDKFLRYLRFITELCAWQDGRLPVDDLEDFTELVYGTQNRNASIHVDFLIRSFDAWIETDIEAVFSSTFASAPSKLDSEDVSKVCLFGASAGTINLFAECCSVDKWRSASRKLLLYAVLLHRLYDTVAFPRRLRILRNLIEASGNEIRIHKMPALVSDVRRLIIDGTLEGLESFNRAQVSDEILKADMLLKDPALQRVLFHLEDHELLRGCLGAFDLKVATFERRARAFHEVFAEATLPLLTGALLAAGDYSQRINHRFMQLGSSSDRAQWREEILTGSSRAHLAGVRDALGRVLDVIAAREGDVRSALVAFTQAWLENTDHAKGLDWRWYFVRYPAMREGRSGIYASSTGKLGYSLCMLDKHAMSSYYRDPFLAAIRRESGVEQSRVRGTVEHWSGEPGFTGYETQQRWMHLTRSDTQMQVRPDGILLRPPPAEHHARVFAGICQKLGLGDEGDRLLEIPQTSVGAQRLDLCDRVEIGAAILREMVAAGL